MKQRLVSWGSYVRSHKKTSFVLLVLIIVIGYWASGAFGSTNTETRYVLGTVEKGTIISSISGSGQVAATDEIDIKPKVSGEITWVGVKNGDVVRAGQAIAQIDNTDAKQDIADAEQSLTQAKLQFQKDSAQAPIDYEKSLESLEDAKADLATTYNDTFNTLSDTYLALPSVMTDMEDALYGYDLSINRSQWNIDSIRNIFTSSNDAYATINSLADIAEKDYKTARAKYDASLVQYKKLTRYSDTAALEDSLADSTDTTTAVAQSLQSTINLLDTLIDEAKQHNVNLSAAINTMRSNAQSNLSTANARLSALLNQQKSLDAAKKAIRDDERDIEIYKIGNPAGNNPISLQSSAYSIADQERKLQDLKDALSDYVVTAPFAGTLTGVTLKRADQVSTGTSVATLITSDQYVELSMNEIDTAKIKVGDKVTLSFDAIDDLSLTGSVAEIDPVGTVSQGVVSYTIKIKFDVQDARVKPGMSVNANIITDTHQNVLVVPQTAVKTQNGQSYVQIFTPALTETGGTQGVTSVTAPQSVPVETGISDNANIEILSGLTEGEQIVTRTITATVSATTQTQSQTPSILGATGVRTGTGGGGNFRAVTR
jgi:HlyD family secretion protein